MCSGSINGICVTSFGVGTAATGAAGVAGASGSATTSAVGVNSSTFYSMILPFYPVPGTSKMSIPSSAARLRASGLAKTRSPSY